MAASSAQLPTEARRNDVTGSTTVQKKSQDHEPQHQEAIQDNHPFISEPDSTADSRTERTGKSQLSSHDRDACPEDSYGVSVISSVAINGRVQQFKNRITPQRWKLVVPGRRIPRAPVAEVTAAFKMEHVQTSKARWQDYVIPWHNIRTGEDLCDGGTKAPAGGSLPGNHDGDGIESTQRQDPPVHPPTGTPGKSSASKSPTAPQNHLEFTGRRNLEHILSKQNSGQRFRANYWVTGKPMIKPESSTFWIAEESLLDTAFQILKAAAYAELWTDKEKDNAANCAAELMSDWAPSWLSSMENSDKRKKYAWPHAEKGNINTYRVGEHVWIWRALKSLEMENEKAWEKMSEKPLGTQRAARADEQVAPGRSPTIDPEKIPRVSDLRKSFSSEVVQRQVSQRFTTETTVLRKRMLATTRSIRQSRFMLHARDTAILYEEPFDFLGQDNSAKELWKTTVQSRIYHTEYQESNWEKTLRHALNIMLGSRDPSINNSQPNKLIREATDILFRSSSPSGFFPGRIETSTKKPVAASCIVEGDIESYYHASFEIPYILLTHMKQVRDAYEWPELEVHKFRRHSDSRLDGNRSLKGSTLHDISLAQGDAEQRQVLLRLSDLLLSRSTVSDLDTREVFPGVRRTSKKAVPFDRLVDSNDIVKLDDEWLYKYPDFFSRGKKLGIDDSDQGLTELKSRLHPREMHSVQFALDDNIKRNLQYCIVDVGSSKRDEGKRTEHHPTYFEQSKDLEDTLDLARTAQESKKRLLSFKMVPEQVALRCYTTTEASERLNLKDFFQRHSRYAKDTFDHCSMIRNSWESEFHLSYYQLLGNEESSNLLHGIAPPQRKSFPGGLAKKIVRASASFRFNGDFFDRHWTCYMLDSSPKGSITNPKLLNERAYCQRKVLEQRYFADILKSLTESAEEILDEVYRCLCLDRESGSFSTSIHTTNAYLSWSAVWQDFEPLVQKLHADLASSQTIVSQWEAREEDRGKEQPRWTSNDERNEQNIAMFTYVTVVFLPLGFAASIFSMSGPPETRDAINMMLASIVALAVTIVALMNAKALASIAESITREFADLTADRKRFSVMWVRKELENRVEMSNAGGLRTVLVHDPSTVAGSWNLIFWTGYIFIEVPARTITAACRAIGWPRTDDKDLEGLKESQRIGPFARSAVASGLRYCLVPSMAFLEMEGAAVLGRSSMNFPREPAAQLVADHKLRKDGYAIRIARVLLGVFIVPVFLPTWILQIVCFNAWDALALLAGEPLELRYYHWRA
ncbi:uncharacterized protein LA080_007702 [Diaporthe eres]|nr:uncharacterized protein LA080_007702 [Diaporthe eres]